MKTTQGAAITLVRELFFRCAHSSVKCNTSTNVGKKLLGEFYSQG